jgi:hypothetical protein
MAHCVLQLGRTSRWLVAAAERETAVARGPYCLRLQLRRCVEVLTANRNETFERRKEWKYGNMRINITLRRVRVTILSWKSSKYYMFWVCVCSLSYPACKAHAPYYIAICGLSGCTIFSHIISCTIFSHIISQTARFLGKKSLNIKGVFWFSLQLLCETFLIWGRIQRDTIKNVHRASCKVPVILVRF